MNSYIELILFILTVVGIILLYRKAEEDEPYLMLKIIGFTVLGCFRLELGEVVLPLGFAVYIVFFRNSNVNRVVKKQAAYFGLIIFFLSLLLPFIATTIYEWPRHIAVQNTNFYEGSMVEEWENIHTTLGERDVFAEVTNFKMGMRQDGKMTDFRMLIIDDGPPEPVHYTITLSKDNKEFIVNRWKQESDSNVNRDTSFTEAEYFLAQLDLLEPSMLNHKDVDYYTLRSTGQRQGYAVTNTEKYSIDTAGKEKVENNQLPFDTIVVEVCDPVCDVSEHLLFDVRDRHKRITEETVMGIARELSTEIEGWLDDHSGYEIAHEYNGEYVLRKDGTNENVSEEEYVQALKDTPIVTVEEDGPTWRVVVKHPYGEAPHVMEFKLNVETREVIEVEFRNRER